MTQNAWGVAWGVSWGQAWGTNEVAPVDPVYADTFDWVRTLTVPAAFATPFTRPMAQREQIRRQQKTRRR